MAKGRHQKDKLWLIHDELSSSKNQKNTSAHPTEPSFTYCALSLTPFKQGDEIVADMNGRMYLKAAAQAWSEQYDCNPITGAALEPWLDLQVTWSEDGEMQCPLSGKALTPLTKLVANKNNGFVYSAAGLKNLAAGGSQRADPMDCSPFNPKTDLISLNDPDRIKDAPPAKLTEEFLQTRRRQAAAPQESPTVSRATGLTKRILDKISRDGGALEASTKRFRSEQNTSEEGYVDPLSGEVKLIASKVHTSGQASAALTSTASRREYGRVFKYLTSREYRTLIYQRMLNRRKSNSEVAISLRLKNPEPDGPDLTLQLTLYAWRFPETAHQLVISAHKKAVKLLQIADDANTREGAREALWMNYDQAFDDVDDEIDLIAKYRENDEFIQPGSVYRCLEIPGAVGIAARSFPNWSDSLYVFGKVSGSSTLEELMQSAVVEVIVKDTFVHADPYKDCEKLAIEEYMAR